MKLFKSAVLLLLLLIVNGCPKSPADGGTPGTDTPPLNSGGAPPTSGQVETARGGVVRLPLDISINDPALAALDFTVPQLWALARAIEVPVVGLRNDSSSILGFAVVDQVSGNGTNWSLKVINVAESIDSPDGIALKIVEHWQALLQGTSNPLNAQLADLIEGARAFQTGRALDVSGLAAEAGSVSITLTRPYHNFASWLTQPGLGLTLPGELPLKGYAPFVLSAIEGNELVLHPNPDYAGDKPFLDELRFVCEPDRERQVELFRTGALDAANVPVVKAARIALDPELSASLVRHESAATLLGIFNYSHFPWNDGEFQSRVGLRQAMNWGINREILGTMHNGQLEPWPHFLPKAYDEFIDPASVQRPLYPLTSMIEDARAGLRLADHDQGIRLPSGMDCAFLPEDNVEDLVVDVLEFWNEVSVKIGPFGEPRQTLDDRIDNSRHEMILKPVRPAYAGPDALFYPQLHSSLTGLGGNWSMIAERGIDDALDKAFSESDPISLQLKLRRLGLELEERSLFIFIGYATPSLLINPQLGGYELSPADYDASLNNQDFTKLGFLAE